MATFIKIEKSYNPLTTQGEGEKLINVEHIIHITKWSNLTNRRISKIKSRIKLLDGEIIEVTETVDKILELINGSKTLDK